MNDRDKLIEEMHTAVLTDNKQNLERLLDGKSLDDVSHDFTKAVGRDIVSYCGTTGSIQCAKFLIDGCGFDVNAENNKHPDGFQSVPPINAAIRSGEIEMVRFLANHPKVHIFTLYQDGSALECAIVNRNYEAIDAIIDAVPSIMDSILWSGHGRDYQMKAVEVSCKYNDLSPIKCIVGHTENNEAFPEGAGVALYHENDMVFNYLVESGLDVSQALIDYASTPDPDAARVERNVGRLFSAGAKVFHNNSYEAAIDALKQGSNRNVAAAFVKNGFDFNVNDGELLNQLLENNMLAELGHAFRHNADPNLLDEQLMRKAVETFNRDCESVRTRSSQSHLDKIDAISAMSDVLNKLDGASMSGCIEYNETELMRNEIVKSIRNDNPEKLKSLLIDNDAFWDSRIFYDDFLMNGFGHHLMGWCLENDARECAKYLINCNLPGLNLNAKGSDESGIEPALSHALACHSNEIVSLLLEHPNVRDNDRFNGVTPLERALINHNYAGAELLIKARNILDPDRPNGLVYHQVKATELSLWGDSRPIEFIIEQSPHNVVMPSVGMRALCSDKSGADKLVDRLFELGLDANEMLIGACAISKPDDFETASYRVKKCLDHGGQFSHNNYAGPLALASFGSPESLDILTYCGFELNEDDGAVLKAAIKTCDAKAFGVLVDAGADANLLDKRVANYIDNPERLTGDLLHHLSIMQSIADALKPNIATEQSYRPMSP